MIARHKVRRQARRWVHAMRFDDRRPAGSIPLDHLREGARAERKKAARKAAKRG